MTTKPVPSNSSSGEEPNTAALLRLYDAYRTSLLNVKYYGYKLKWTTRANRGMEIVIAIAASSVSGWAIWRSDAGSGVWTVIAGAAAVLVVIKPFLPFSKNIATYSKLYAGHNSNFLTLKDVVETVAIQKRFTRDAERELNNVLKRHRELSAFDDPSPSPKFVDRLQTEVNAQIPADSLWCPQPLRSSLLVLLASALVVVGSALPALSGSALPALSIEPGTPFPRPKGCCAEKQQLSNSFAAQIQRTLCVRVDGKMGPETRKAINTYLTAKQQHKVPYTLPLDSPVTRTLLSQAVDDVPDCKQAGYENAFEVALYGGRDNQDRIKSLQAALNVPQTGILDASTRSAIAQTRTNLAINPGLRGELDEQLLRALTSRQ